MIKTGVLTGGGNGIGFATLKSLLKNNYKIINITRSNNNSLERLKRKYNNKVINYFNDFSDINKTRDLSKKIFAKYKIDFLINNAGLRSRYYLDKVSDETYESVFNTNYHSPMILTTEFVKSIKKSKNYKIKRSIVSITSIVGSKGFDELSVYAASKGALEYGMKSLSVELANLNIRVNCIAPGFTKTSYFKNFKTNKKKLYKWTLDQIPMKRWAEPSEISDVIEFLISNKSSYITGTTIYVDGGWI